MTEEEKEKHSSTKDVAKKGLDDLYGPSKKPTRPSYDYGYGYGYNDSYSRPKIGDVSPYTGRVYTGYGVSGYADPPMKKKDNVVDINAPRYTADQRAKYENSLSDAECRKLALSYINDMIEGDSAISVVEFETNQVVAQIIDELLNMLFDKGDLDDGD